MNDLLHLKGSFIRGSAPRPGAITLPKGAVVTSDHMRKLAVSIGSVCSFWESTAVDIEPLVTVYYNRTVAKSNRVKRLLDSRYGKASKYIVGAKFNQSNASNRKHVITYRVAQQELQDTQNLLYQCADLIDRHYEGEMTPEKLKVINDNGLKNAPTGLLKTKFAQVVRECVYVERFGIEQDLPERLDSAFVTFFDTGISIEQLLSKLEVPFLHERILGNSVLLEPAQYELIRSKAPFLIAMAVEDLSELNAGCFPECDYPAREIPPPRNEPTIGVIDTQFDSRVYFSEWVTSTNALPKEIGLTEEDFKHGTAVTSVIVDGPALNPDLEDHCGRFRVRHFGVALQGCSSSFAIMRNIKEIVEANPDIKVWNLSLDSVLEVAENSISPEASILDQLQSKRDIIFVVAGTNKTNTQVRVGAPADSINSLVVNSVDRQGASADYTRCGPVLSFYGKPDVSYYGGVKGRETKLAAPFGIYRECGTSYAAPWIARKMAYLIHVAGMTRETAKALLIDSSVCWDQDKVNCTVGYGVVPIDIKDILKTKNDEIRFLINGVADTYQTFCSVPVPVKEGKFPYVARATLCYFPECDRNQGVDYTATELDLHFGRLAPAGIKSVDNNIQGDKGSLVAEDEARKYFRKWDNVKHKADCLTDRTRPRKAYDNNLWGVKIRMTERGEATGVRKMPFSLVVTLKELKGVNRISEFVYQCVNRGWLVNRINIDNRIDIYEAAEVEIDFDE